MPKKREDCLFDSDEDLIRWLKARIRSMEIWTKALDVVQKRIASPDLSDHMLLHIIRSLSISGAENLRFIYINDAIEAARFGGAKLKA